ncbi:MAG: glycosyltransferase [Caulobacteraceae bacterium]
MLARLISQEPASTICVVSLGGISGECRELLDGCDVELISLGARGPLDLFSTVVRLAATIRTRAPASISSWMYHACVVSALSVLLARYNGPIAWSIHATYAPRELGLFTSITARAAALLSWVPGTIIYVSQAARRQHLKLGYHNKRSVVIANGVELPRRVHRRARISVIGMAARFHPQKDYLTFLRACAHVSARYPHLRFEVAGEAAEMANVNFAELVDRSGMSPAKLIAHGELGQMAPFYERIDLLVLSSVSSESFPNVLLEAMSHGVPCVTTNVGDSGSIVGDTGLVVPPSDPHALAGAMCAMVSFSPAAIKRRGQSARRRVKDHYQIKFIARQYREIIATLDAAQEVRSRPTMRS